MKRFHVHVAVDDLAQSIRFYSTLFAAAPAVVKDDYAKWMLDDPRVNFAVSTTGSQDDARQGGARHPAGISHLGIQVEDERELGEVYARLSRAERPVVEEKDTVCCYARSDKQWIADPSGIAWETFLTHEEAAVYGSSGAIGKLGEANGGLSTCACGPVGPAEPAAAETASCCAR
ncbi:MAG TPA: ArsI/CadI family heavy metal resistance metalloenzyme [Stellaceae bacterium]|nr:ArsI/CadI family heavy metal resistance metalloenzyme [Stellaceae bacterium]